MLMVALIIPILGLVALVIDVGRARLASEHLDDAVDSAAMTGAQHLHIGQSTAIAQAEAAFNTAFPDGLLGAEMIEPVGIVPGSQGGAPTLTVTARAEVPTLFMQLFDRNSLEIAARATAREQGSGPFSYQLLN